jgi:hypothetical protein
MSGDRYHGNLARQQLEQARKTGAHTLGPDPGLDRLLVHAQINALLQIADFLEELVDKR